jgi:hypothetical protein
MIESHQTHEYHAEQVLKRLRGYMTRQPWLPDDRMIIADILREWADEVELLESSVRKLEADLVLVKAEVEQWRNAAYSHRSS